MAKQRKLSIFGPKKESKSSLPGTVKDEMETKAKELIEKVLKPKHIQPSPEGSDSNYITDISLKWLGSKCFFVSTYPCPGPNAMSPTFEEKFARMEHVGDGKFNLSFMRHTGDWVPLFEGLSIGECMTAIRDDPWFVP